MKTQIINDQKRLYGLFLVLGLSFVISQAKAAEPVEQATTQVPCAILQKFEGDVQIMDPTRTHILETDLKSVVPCGAWISVKTGWAEVLHRQGYQFNIGPGTFVEVYDNVKDRTQTGENHLVVYRGKVYMRVPKGSDELKVATASARARLTHGAALIVFSQWDEETQLTALEREASLENRFEPSRKIVVKAGEASSLNLKAMRIVPSAPEAVQVASLKAALADLHIEAKEAKVALLAATQRKERKFATILVDEEKIIQNRDRDDDDNVGSRRSLASQPTPPEGGKDATYSRHTPHPDEEKAQQVFISKLVGGERSGEKILYPEKFMGKPRKSRVVIEDRSFSVGNRKIAEDEEKKRLIDELTKIREE